MLFIWILPISIITGFMNRGVVQPDRAVVTPKNSQTTAAFVPDPSKPPKVTQGSGTR
jgi:hypothetical protein